jgi:hypothetical protein
MAGFADQDSAAIIEKRRKNQKKKKSPVPTGIEIEACYQNKYILMLVLFIKNKPIKYKNDWQKN